MSTPMLDFERNDITSIVRIHYPLSGIRTAINMHDKEQLTILCTDEEHEKLVADYLAWKDAKGKKFHPYSLGSQLERIKERRFADVAIENGNVGVDENGEMKINGAKYDGGLPTPKQAPPMPKSFDTLFFIKNDAPAIKIEEITDTVYDCDFVLELAGRLIEKAKQELGSCKSPVIKTPSLVVTLVFDIK